MIRSLLFILLGVWGLFLPQQEMYHRNGQILSVTNQDSSLNTTVVNDLVDTFFSVYPRLKKDFNPNAMDTVAIRIDTAYNGVAYTSDDHIVISSTWLHKRPHDTDLLTHEVMHVIQSYPPHSGPGWLTEGIADYVRYKYGINNKSSGWALTSFNPSQSYKNSYRITARFLVWLTQHYDENLVKKLDEHLRNRTYSKLLWKKYTGRSLDKLWETYSKDSDLSK